MSLVANKDLGDHPRRLYNVTCQCRVDRREAVLLVRCKHQNGYPGNRWQKLHFRWEVEENRITCNHLTRTRPRVNSKDAEMERIAGVNCVVLRVEAVHRESFECLNCS